MQRAGFECEDCGSKDKMLQVHHSYYEKGKPPWKYPDENLHCLCEDCHRKVQDTKLLLNRQLGKLELSDMAQLLGYSKALEAKSLPMVPIDVSSYEFAVGVGDCWGLTAEVITAALQDGVIDGYKLHALAQAKRRVGKGI
ncbi:MAG: HNH endonuclease [Thermodesulfobacteriota bacterium]